MSYGLFTVLAGCEQVGKAKAEEGRERIVSSRQGSIGEMSEASSAHPHPASTLLESA